MKPLAMLTVIVILFAFTAPGKLAGRWESISKTGNVTHIFFKPDNTFEGFINKKPFVTGTYSLDEDVFTLEDNGCKFKGAYKIIFFSNSDSMRFEHISDTCVPRRNGMLNLVLGKVK